MPNMGINVPHMGMKAAPKVSEAAAIYATASLSDALFTHTQQRVLGALFGAPGRSLSVSELIQCTGAGSGAVQREVARLAGSGLLAVESIGRQKRYRANPEAPIYAELVGIVRKTFGLAAPLREALSPFGPAVRAAFVFGSVAKGEDTGRSDIDLLVLSDTLAYGELMAALEPVSEALGRRVNPTLYTVEDFTARRRSGQTFLARVMAQPRIWVIGGEHALPA
ncbi:nucleotidyltransferase domain-containing protein [Silanimonas lenta]|uniref:nucleotidyltransferase domain-containing protein n=1 Tax=Silanimonas lenta TaxID=265429 RepID=UPI001FDFC11E|nr:nucleotidyltransferase domain-containing protein [Silanimonas lenta]